MTDINALLKLAQERMKKNLDRTTFVTTKMDPKVVDFVHIVPTHSDSMFVFVGKEMDFVEPNELKGQGTGLRKGYTACAYALDGIVKSHGYAFCSEKDTYSQKQGMIKSLVDCINYVYDKDLIKKYGEIEEAVEEKGEVLSETLKALKKSFEGAFYLKEK